MGCAAAVAAVLDVLTACIRCAVLVVRSICCAGCLYSANGIACLSRTLTKNSHDVEGFAGSVAIQAFQLTRLRKKIN